MLTAHDVMEYISNLADQVQEEKADAIEALATLRFIAKSVGKAQEIVDPLAIKQAEGYPKTFTHGGLTWTKKEGSKRWDYKGVPELIELDEQVKLAQKKAQQAANMLERMSGKVGPDGYVYDQDGEIIGFPAKPTSTKESLTLGQL